MESLSNFFLALSHLAWPALFGISLFKFYQPLKKLIESAQDRKFTIKVAGNELTMEEVSEQQWKIVNDLQSKIAEIEKNSDHSITMNFDAAKSVVRRKHILWVDDSPKNNSFLVASLQRKGHSVDIALSTDEGVRKFKSQTYDIVISDMGRPEDKKAGITLSKELQSLGSKVPFYIFCGDWAARNLQEEAISNGVTYITASGTSLLIKLPLSNGN